MAILTVLDSITSALGNAKGQVVYPTSYRVMFDSCYIRSKGRLITDLFCFSGKSTKK